MINLIDAREGFVSVRQYLKEAQDLLSHYPDDLKVVVDIGAHIGTVSLQAVENGAKFVLAVEPSSQNYNYLVENIDLNKVSELICPLSMAVADESFQEKKLYINVLNSGQRTLTAPYETLSYEKVWTLSLAEILAPVISKYKKVDLLKIDVEGEEYNILRPGLALDCMLAAVRCIDCECHEEVDGIYYSVDNIIPSRAQALASYLESLGFSVNFYGTRCHLRAIR